MIHKDHVSLIKDAIPKSGGVWADLGSGEGAFTLALRDVTGKDVEIYSVDKYSPSLDAQEKQFAKQFPESNVHFLHIDFTEELHLPPLDGILMANSLHYIKNQERFLTNVRRYLKRHGILLLVEYNATAGNQWVPYPIAFERFKVLAEHAGFAQPSYVKGIASQFLNEIYSAVTTLL